MRDRNARRKGLNLARIGTYPSVGIPWLAGQKTNVVPEQPIRFELDTEKGGDQLPEMFMVSVPLFSRKLLDALQSAGVDNLQVFAAEIADRKRDRIFGDYFAVNIVGLVACADMALSLIEPTSAPPMAEFRELVIDETKAMGQHLFRLAENTRIVLVSQQVRDLLQSRDFVGVALLRLSDPGACR
jgi:hypothetical protein